MEDDIADPISSKPTAEHRVNWPANPVLTVADFDTQDSAEPGKGYAGKVAEWHAKLPEANDE